MNYTNYPISRLTRQEFAAALQKGLGRAFLYVKQYGVEDVKDLILKACLHDQARDPQVEGSKAKWLFEMIRDAPDYSYFRESILNSLKRKRETWDLQQLFELAREMAMNGDIQARAVIKERAFKKASKRSLDEWLGAIEWSQLAGIEGALDIARIYGQRLLVDPEDFVPDIIFLYDDEISTDFQKRLFLYAQKEPGLQAYQNYLEKRGLLDTTISQENREILKQQASERKRQQFNLEVILKNARNKVGEFPNQYSIFGRFATQEEKEIVLSHFLLENDDEVRLRLLWVFRHSPLPRIIDEVIQWVEQENPIFYSAAIDALAQFSDPRARELAILKIKSSKLQGIDTEILKLFINNYTTEDSEIITQSLLTLRLGKEDAHDLSWYLIQIAEKHKAFELTDALKWAYEKTPCSDCRYRIVNLLDTFKALDNEILNECQFDSNEKIAALAKKKLGESAFARDHQRSNIIL